VHKSAGTCPFCRYGNSTAGNAFIKEYSGRILVVDADGIQTAFEASKAKAPQVKESGASKLRTRKSEIRMGVSSANAFPASRLHGIVFSGQHSILALQPEDFRQMARAAIRWFDGADAAARDADNGKKSVFRVITFDSSPSAGASQLHPHLQLFAMEDSWPTKWRRWFEPANRFNFASKLGNTRRNYFKTFVEAHLNLGLGIQAGRQVYVLAHLTPVKNGEVLVIDLSSSSSSSSTHFFDVVFQVVRMFRSQAKFSVSVGIALSPAGRPSNKGKKRRVVGQRTPPPPPTPSVARIVPRNSVGDAHADVSAFDFYLRSVISEDPFDVARTIKQFFKTEMPLFKLRGA